MLKAFAGLFVAALILISSVYFSVVKKPLSTIVKTISGWFSK